MNTVAATNDKPLVTIGLMVYNDSHLKRKTIYSLLVQGYENLGISGRVQ